MKYSLLILSLLTTFIACSSSKIVSSRIYPLANEEHTTSTGSRMIEHHSLNSKGVDLLNWYLLYAGKEGDNIKLVYNEFYNPHDYKNLALIKPDYTVEYKYDIEENNIIYFRDYMIKIVGIDESRIKFILMENPCENPQLKTLQEKNDKYEYAKNKSFIDADELSNKEMMDLDSLKKLCDEYKAKLEIEDKSD